MKIETYREQAAKMREAAEWLAAHGVTRIISATIYDERPDIFLPYDEFMPAFESYGHTQNVVGSSSDIDLSVVVHGVKVHAFMPRDSEPREYHEPIEVAEPATT